MPSENHVADGGEIQAAPRSSTNPPTVSCHTPGPWVLWRGDGYTEIRSTEGVPDHVATVWGTHPQDDNPEEEWHPIHRAAARLIAAAPDMLTALRDLLAYLDHHHWGTVPEGETAERARAAIARATGGQS